MPSEEPGSDIYPLFAGSVLSGQAVVAEGDVGVERVASPLIARRNRLHPSPECQVDGQPRPGHAEPRECPWGQWEKGAPDETHAPAREEPTTGSRQRQQVQILAEDADDRRAAGALKREHLGDAGHRSVLPRDVYAALQGPGDHRFRPRRGVGQAGAQLPEDDWVAAHSDNRPVGGADQGPITPKQVGVAQGSAERRLRWTCQHVCDEPSIRCHAGRLTGGRANGLQDHSLETVDCFVTKCAPV